MNKLFTSAAVAAALLVAAPVAAQAGDHGRHGNHDRHDGYHHSDRRDHSHNDYRRMQRYEFSHWRPHLERQHYRGFGRPVYYNNYYRVRAYDPRGHIVFLNVNAFTGVILSVGY